MRFVIKIASKTWCFDTLVIQKYIESAEMLKIQMSIIM